MMLLKAVVFEKENSKWIRKENDMSLFTEYDIVAGARNIVLL